MVAMEVEDRTVYAGNLHRNVNNFLLYELFLQAGPIEKIAVETASDGNRVGVIAYKYRASIPYAKNVFRGTRLFDRELKLSTDNLLDDAEKRVNEARDRMLQNGHGVERELRIQHHRQMSGRPDFRRDFERERWDSNPYDRHNDRRFGGGHPRYGNDDRSRDRHRRYDSRSRRY